MVRQAVFQYKTIKGLLHKLPSMLKLFLLLPISVICMALPSLWLCAGIITAIIIAFLCRFTLREQFTDLKPAFLYALIMYALSVFSNVFNYFNGIQQTVNFSMLNVLLPHYDFIRIALRLTLIIQISALFFRTTSRIEIRECLNSIEIFIRRIFSKLPVFGKFISSRSDFSENISLFLTFIPEIFLIWTNINTAWKARCGKNGLKKINMLVFVLISLSFEKAVIKAKALEARKLLI